MDRKIIRSSRPHEDKYQILLPEQLRIDSVPEEIKLQQNLAEAAQREAELREAMSKLERYCSEIEQRRDGLVEEAQRSSLLQARDETRESVDKMLEISRELEQQRSELIRDAQKMVVDVAMAVSARILGHAVDVDEGIVLETVRRSLSCLADSDSLTIRLNPQDVDFIEEHKEEVEASAPRSGRFEVVPDNSVGRGGCLVETTTGDVDGRIESQLHVLAEALRESIG